MIEFFLKPLAYFFCYEFSYYNCVLDVHVYCCIITMTVLQVQGSDPIDATEEFAPVNVVAIDVSKLRSVLTIIEADTLNAGTYQCVATSEASNEIIMKV